MRRLIGLILGLAVVAAACGGSDDAESDPPAGVEPTPGFVVLGASDDGVLTVEAPEASSAAEVEITVTRIEPDDVAGDPLFEDSEVLAAYNLGPDGQQFDQPVTLTFRIARDQFELGDDETPLLLIASRTGDANFEPLDDLSITLDGTDLVVSGTTTHFSPVTLYDIGLKPDWGKIEGQKEAGGSAVMELTMRAWGDHPYEPVVDEHGNSFEIEMRTDIGGIFVFDKKAMALDELASFAFSCEDSGQYFRGFIWRGVFNGEPTSVFFAYVRLTCTEPATTTTTTLPSPDVEAFDVPFGVNLTIVDDGTMLLAGFSGLLTFDPTQPVVVGENPKQAEFPTQADFEVNGECPDNLESCSPELLGYDAAEGCFWISLPDGALNCYKLDGAGGPPAVDTKACEVKVEKGPGETCDPQSPQWIEGIDAPFFRLGGGALGFVKEGSFTKCFQFDKHDFQFEDISFADDKLTVPTYHVFTNEITTRTISWPDCEELSSETGGVREDVDSGGQVDIGGTTYTVATAGTETVTLTSNGTPTELTFDDAVCFTQTKSVDAEGTLYIYVPGVGGVENGECGPDYDNGGIYIVSLADGTAEKVATVGRVISLAYADGVLWRSEIVPNRVIPFVLQ